VPDLLPLRLLLVCWERAGTKRAARKVGHSQLLKAIPLRAVAKINFFILGKFVLNAREQPFFMPDATFSLNCY
jgi:hypothetical protein